jgi:transcriptional regulator with XRE-family HTH domain
MSATHTARYRQLLLRLREARQKAGLTQAEVAQRLRRPQSFVSKIEAGERRVDAIELQDLATIYRRSVAWFLRWGRARRSGRSADVATR